MPQIKPIRLAVLKLQAGLLYKDLKRNDQKAISRLMRFPKFGYIIKDRELQERIKLKHAYRILALEYGFESWTELKEAVVDKDCLYRPALVPLVHAWFGDYDQAQAYFSRHGGYLLSFWNDIIVCGSEYIHGLGLGGLDTHWRRIGFDWVRPADKQAWEFLSTCAKKSYLSQQ